jgi:hypothetical protein
MSYIVFSMNFITLYNFLKFILEKRIQKLKKQVTVVGRRFGPRPRPAGLAQPWNRLASMPAALHGRTHRLVTARSASDAGGSGNEV